MKYNVGMRTTWNSSSAREDKQALREILGIELERYQWNGIDGECYIIARNIELNEEDALIMKLKHSGIIFLKENEN